MKNRIAPILVAALFALPALAQTTTTTTAPAAAPAASTSTNATGKTPLAIETKEGFWGRVNPFARKKYVQRQLHPVADRLNELDELTAGNTKNIKDVDGRAQAGIKLAADKANEADQHAIDAGNRANTAQTTAQAANTRLTGVETAVGSIDQYHPINQAEIRFRPGQNVLSKPAKEALDGMATTLKDQRGYVVEVQGFSSGHGQTAIGNSQKMADAVVRYLVLNHDIPVYRIFVVGMGNAPKNDADGKPIRISGGRVEVSLLKNNLDQLASGAAPVAPADAPQTK
jgi:outer membrane protein OmpA-like peptidoglycan-associated protein